MRTRLSQRQSPRPARRRVSGYPGGTLLAGPPEPRPATAAARVVLANPACDPDGRQLCEHPLVDRALNKALHDYEAMLMERFAAVETVLREVAEMPRGADFVAEARQLVRARLGCDLPASMLGGSWMTGFDMPSVFAHCLFDQCRLSVNQASAEQAQWLRGMAIDDAFIAKCGYHTLDVSPCADGRLQGVLPFVLRVCPSSDAVSLKAYAGALFDVELDMADWAQRELGQRLNARHGARYLKIAIYHYSSAAPSSEGCAAHGSDEAAAREAAAERLEQLREGVAQAFGRGLGPEVLLLGVDTDLDAIRIHLPTAQGAPSPSVSIEAALLYRETLTMTPDEARAHIAQSVEEAAAVAGGGAKPGLKRLMVRLLEANLSQIEYVIQHHEGRYARLGHGERFICVGDPIEELQMRNLYYFAHLDTLEEGAACVDVGVHIFEKLNLARGFPAPVIVHFGYASVIPGARTRAVERGERVINAIMARYRGRVPAGALKFALCVSDATGDERLGLVRECFPATGDTEGKLS